MNEKHTDEKDKELTQIRGLLKKQNSMLGQSLLFSDHLLYLQKSDLPPEN